MIQAAFDAKVRCARARIGAHAASGRMITAATLLLICLHAAFGIAHADVPTLGDMTACNQEARDELRGGTASPTEKDEAGADNARKAQAGTGERPEATPAVTRSPDPQIDGMDAEGAKDAAYRATYRVCMRKRGF
jgi:hypothetical protein